MNIDKVMMHEPIVMLCVVFKLRIHVLGQIYIYICI